MSKHFTRDEDGYGCGERGGGRAGVVARVGDLGALDEELRVRAPPRGRRHRDAALAVVVDHALVVVPEHVPEEDGLDCTLWHARELKT